MSTLFRCACSTSLVLFMALLSRPEPGATQEPGTITGTVTNAQTGRPVAGVQLSVPGTGRGTLSAATGRYLIVGITPGEVTVRAEIIGYGTVEETVFVSAGQAAVLDFQMTERAIALEELVVTGTGRATEKRKLGNSVGSVNASQLTEDLPINRIDQLLNGRTAGVNMQLSGGTVGTGGNIRIRGMSSVALNSDPVVYIDGVRVNAAADHSSPSMSMGGQDFNRIEDLNPADIDRIEVVKGAAAATLYGTQGSNGVIQIFTKRGRTGAPQWTFEMTQGFQRMPTDTFPGQLFDQFVGPTGFRARNPKEIVENGHVHSYGASVAGGTDDVTYYVSGNFRGEEGSVAPNTNWMKQGTVTSNMSSVLAEGLTLGVRSSFAYTRGRMPDNDNGLHGVYSQAVSAIPYTADEDRVYGERWGSFVWNQTLENRQTVFRNTTGVTLQHRPSARFNQSLTAGIDWFREESTKLFPFAYKGAGYPLGARTNWDRFFRDITVDYKATVTNQLTQGITSDFTVGTQGNFTNTIRVVAEGENFPGPGVTTVSATSLTEAQERRVEEINAGIFIQETVGLGDKVFLTAGLRADGNSAFGNQFDIQYYPKASVAYDITRESFWPSGQIPTMKLRFAYGTSGLAPAQFAADRTFEPISAEEGVPAVTPGNIGDPELGPETSTEYEIGFDAGFWQDRVGLEFTAFYQKTTDALLEKQATPTLGFLNPQLRNIGEIRNKGIEMGVNALLYQGIDFQWNARMNFSAQSNEVTSLGGAVPFSTSGISGGWVKEGYPVQGIWGYDIGSWDPVARKHTRSDTLVYRGQSDPTWFGSFSTDLRWRDLTLSAMFDYEGGNVICNFTRWWLIRVKTGDDYLSRVEKPNGNPTPASDSILDYALTLNDQAPLFMSPGDYITLRELALTYQLPETWPGRVGLGRTTIRLSGRDLFEWSRYVGLSPQVEWNGSVNLGRGGEFDTQPPLRRFTFSIRTII